MVSDAANPARREPERRESPGGGGAICLAIVVTIVGILVSSCYSTSQLGIRKVILATAAQT
jgi:hypothetical protein